MVDDFSEAYFVMPDVEVIEYGGDTCVVAEDFMRGLAQYVSAPLVKLPTGHYWLSPEWGVPADTIAVPESDDETHNPLLAKDSTTKSLLNKGIVDQP